MKHLLMIVGLLLVIVGGYKYFGGSRVLPGYTLTTGSPFAQKLQVHANPLPVPEVKITDPKGQEQTLTSLKGDVVVLTVWATWCPACIADLPELEALAKHFAPQPLRVVSVVQEMPNASSVAVSLEQMAAYYNLHHTHLYRDNMMSVSQAFKAVGLPTTFILNKAGEEVARFVGPWQWASDEVKGWLQELVDAS